MAPTPKRKNPVNDPNEQHACTPAKISNRHAIKKSTKEAIPKKPNVCTRSSIRISRTCEVEKTTEIVVDECNSNITDVENSMSFVGPVNENVSAGKNVCTPVKISKVEVTGFINETAPKQENVTSDEILKIDEINKSTNETNPNVQNVSTSDEILNNDGVQKSINETAKDILCVFSKKFKMNTTESNKNSKIESEYDIAEEYAEAIRLASELPKGKRLELFNEIHLHCASFLINIFSRIPQNELKQVVEYAKTRVNIELLQYAYTVALLHRNDLNIHLEIPSHASIQPDIYFDMTKFKDYLQNTSAIRIAGSKKYRILVPISKDLTATDLDPEHRCSYFREDIGLNLHHRHWHEVYPYNASAEIVTKDRRGELFYYMHQQIIARLTINAWYRYNFERLSNRLHRVEPYEDFKEPIKEAYFPKLNSISGDNDFGSRSANIILKDLKREQVNVKLSTIELWRHRIYEAIDRGQAYAIDKITLHEVLRAIDPVTGIDELGNTIEAVGLLSWNTQYYGSLHNRGHDVLGYAHDPDNRFKEQSGVMTFSEAAGRDPIFYRWHEHLDNIFQYYKRTLPPYTPEQKQFQGIHIHSVKILPQFEKIENIISQDEGSIQVTNVLKTFWENDVVDVTQGVIRGTESPPKEDIFAVFTHLQHEDFIYEIEVRNDLPKTVFGTVRIFLAPHHNEAGKKMPFNEQRRLFIELDKFTVRMEASTTTTIKQKSIQSSITIPFGKTFMSYKDAKKIVRDGQINQTQPNLPHLNQLQPKEQQLNYTQSDQPQINQQQLNQLQLSQSQPNQLLLLETMNELQSHQPQLDQPQPNLLQQSQPQWIEIMNQLQSTQGQSNQPQLDQPLPNQPQQNQQQTNKLELSQPQLFKPELNQPRLKKLQSSPASNSYCSCGWPHHLLIGKGTPGKGLLCDLFVMITNYEDDKVEESPQIQNQSCSEKASISYCGVRNKRYPDRKSMGFPFDRNISNTNQFIEDFMTDGRSQNTNRILSRFSNMTLVPVLVRHLEETPRCGQSLRNLGCTDELYEKIA